MWLPYGPGFGTKQVCRDWAQSQPQKRQTDQFVALDEGLDKSKGRKDRMREKREQVED